MAGNEQKDRKGRIRQVVAWVGTFALLTYLAATTDLDQVWRALGMANLPLFAAAVVGITFLTWFSDVATARMLLQRAGFPVGFGDYSRAKGASYLLNIVNYNLGLVLLAAVVSRRSERGLGASGSPFILMNFLDLAAMGLLVVGGLLAGASPFPPEPTLLLAIIGTGAVLGGPVLCGLARIRSAPGWIGRLLAHDLLSAFRALRPADIALIVGVRLVFVSEYVLMQWLFLWSFGFDMQKLNLWVINPILGLIGFIPISVSGIGTTQVAMRSLFGPAAPAGVDPTSAVDACSTLGILSMLLVRILIGLACLPWVTRALAKRDER